MSLDLMILQSDLYNPKLNMPLIKFSGTRDIKFTDIGLGNTSTSFLRNTFGTQGSSAAQGLPWLGDEANTTPSPNFDAERIIRQVRSLAYTLKIQNLEEQRAMLTSVDIVNGKMYALQQAHQFNQDKYIYIGDDTINVTGLINDPDVSQGNAVYGNWINADPDQIIYDITEALTAANENSAFAVNSSAILLPYAQYNYIYSTPRSSISDTTILQFILRNNTSIANGVDLKIFPVKWLLNAGEDDTQRMVVYNNDTEYLRLPIMPLQPFKAIENLFGYERSYIARFGEIEFVYPETLLYRDGI